MVLIDTSVWIDFFSRSPGPAGAELRRMIEDSEPFALAGIVVTEILQGLRGNAREIEHYLNFWELLEPGGISTYSEAASIYRLARSKGISVSTIDCLIAAIALEHNAAIFTLDKGFSRIAKLTPLRLYSLPDSTG